MHEQMTMIIVIVIKKKGTHRTMNLITFESEKLNNKYTIASARVDASMAHLDMVIHSEMSDSIYIRYSFDGTFQHIYKCVANYSFSDENDRFLSGQNNGIYINLNDASIRIALYSY